MAAPVTLSPGSIFAGDFRIERPLAEGGMGAVYVVEQLSTGKRRALKVMHPNLVPDEKSRARFVEEARVGGRIDSDYVVEVLAAGVDGDSGIPWLVMELLEGRDLDQLVQESGPLAPAEIVELMQQIAHALGAAHRLGIIHRDLKPENLFLARSRRRNEEHVPKILDFGIARMVDGNRTAATVTSAIGSPLWMAPEQAQPGAKLRPSTDVWALGLITFYLLTGRYYWEAANHEQFNLSALLVEVMTRPIVPPSQRAASFGVNLPLGFDAWFLRCVERDPMQRFSDATEAVDALAVALGGAAPGPVVARTAPMPSSRGFGHATTARFFVFGHPPGATATPSHADVSRSSGSSLGLILAGLLAGGLLLSVAGLAVGVMLIGGSSDETDIVSARTVPVPPVEPIVTVPPPGPLVPPVAAIDDAPLVAEVEAPPLPEATEESGTGSAGSFATGGPGRRRPAAQPRVRTGNADVRGSLSSEIIRRVVRRHINEARFCYEQELNQRPGLAGRITVSFIISPTGRVQSASVGNSTMRNARVEACLTQAVRRWVFPAPEGGGVVGVNYPFVFSAG